MIHFHGAEVNPFGRLQANFTKKLLASWLSIRLELIGSMTTVAVAAYAVATHPLDDDSGYKIPIGWIAVGLVSALAYTNMLKVGRR